MLRLQVAEDAVADVPVPPPSDEVVTAQHLVALRDKESRLGAPVDIATGVAIATAQTVAEGRAEIDRAVEEAAR